MTVTIDATSFLSAERELAKAVKAKRSTYFVHWKTPKTISGKTVIFGFAGGGSREWGSAAMNVGINLYADTEDDCNDLVLDVQNILATLSNSAIIRVATPAGGATTIPGQDPPFHRYFVVTAHLRGQAAL